MLTTINFTCLHELGVRHQSKQYKIYDWLVYNIIDKKMIEQLEFNFGRLFGYHYTSTMLRRYVCVFTSYLEDHRWVLTAAADTADDKRL